MQAGRRYPQTGQIALNGLRPLPGKAHIFILVTPVICITLYLHFQTGMGA